MKKIIIIAIASAAMVLFASCQKTPISAEKGFGYLSFSEFTLGLDETVETKATAASGNYTITIKDADGNELAHISLPYGPWPWVDVGGVAYADVNKDIDLEFLSQLVDITVTTGPKTE